MTLTDQVIGFVCSLTLLAGFIWVLTVYVRAGRGSRVAIVVSSWVLVVILYRVVLIVPKGWGMGWIVFMALGFVFIFAFWGVIDFVIHANLRLRGSAVARLAQGMGLLILSAALFVAAYFAPDLLDSLPLNVGFGGHFVGLLGAATAAILCFRAGAMAVYADRTAIPDLLAARNAKVGVAPGRDTYLAGEAVDASVRYEIKRDVDLRGARAELLYLNRYSYLTPDPRGGSLLVDETDSVVVGTQAIPQAGAKGRGKTLEHLVSLAMPEVVPPTGRGEITDVTWAVRVVLEISGGPNLRAEAPITVLSTRDTFSSRVEGEPEGPAECGMRFRLPARSFRAGALIEGGLVVSPRQGFEAQEVRIELLRRETVLRDDGNGDETVEAKETVAKGVSFGPKTSQKYDLRVAVPQRLACPSSETEHTYVGWFLRGVIERRLHSDYTLEQELNIYSGSF